MTKMMSFIFNAPSRFLKFYARLICFIFPVFCVFSGRQLHHTCRRVISPISFSSCHDVIRSSTSFIYSGFLTIHYCRMRKWWQAAVHFSGITFSTIWMPWLRKSSHTWEMVSSLLHLVVGLPAAWQRRRFFKPLWRGASLAPFLKPLVTNAL